jgi:hypothetical protein
MNKYEVNVTYTAYERWVVEANSAQEAEDNYLDGDFMVQSTDNYKVTATEEGEA